jgi:transposase
MQEIVTVERRRRWSDADKQRIVAETLQPGVSVSSVARRYGLHASQLFAWRKAMRGSGEPAPHFHPVVIAEDGAVGAVGAGPASGAASPTLVVRLANGYRVSVPPGFDAGHLRQVLDLLEGR